ncbi:MFS transporter [Kineosporia babensis]|uniref:MFS transporter n=1 Tax=Kineosporia babensis TaxID=499548 RepID=A0A9X1NMD6_9ACTN|nr:MFS transporter [Kineosporia babensis]
MDSVSGERLPRGTAFYLGVQTAIERLLLFVVPVAVYRQTGSLSSSGLAYVAEWLPVIVLLPLVGAVVDRSSGPRLLRVTNICRAVVCALVGLSTTLGLGVVPLVLAGSVLGVANIFAYIIFERYVSGFSGEGVATAYSYFQTLQYTMLLAMPVVGGLALSGHGLPWLFALCAAVYAVAALLGPSMQLPAASEPGEAEPSWPDRLRAAVQLARNPLARTVIVLLFAVNLTYGVLYTALPALTSAGGHADVLLPLGYGSAALISLLYFRSAAWLHRHHLVAKLGIAAALTTAGAPLALATTNTPVLAVVVFAVSIGPMVAFTIWSRVVRNQLLDPRHFSLQASVIMTGTTAAYPVAGAYLGLVGDRVPAQLAVAAVSVVCLGMVVTTLVSLRRGQMLGAA